jgi:hypothetical protein
MIGHKCYWDGKKWLHGKGFLEPCTVMQHEEPAQK